MSLMKFQFAMFQFELVQFVMTQFELVDSLRVVLIVDLFWSVQRQLVSRKYSTTVIPSNLSEPNLPIDK